MMSIHQNWMNHLLACLQMNHCIFLLDQVVRNSSCISLKVCFMDLSQLDMFMKQVNEIHACTTPVCKGILVREHVRYTGLGGAISIKYVCNGCVCKTAHFETSTKYEPGRSCDISTAIQVAFIVAGCTHMTYYKVLK